MPVVTRHPNGSILGVLPGGGATLSSFAAYVLEKKVARDPSRFGHGAVEGVAAVSEILARHFPADGSSHKNELSDAPVVL